jgi:hypothetical protein
LSKAWTCSEAKHGRVSAGHVSLAERHEKQIYHKHKADAYNEEEGNAIRVVFEALVKEMREMGLHSRMHPAPAAASNAKTMHNKLSGKFALACRPPWLDMNRPQQWNRLAMWLFEKFCQDRMGQEMLPASTKRRKLAPWQTTDMTSQENYDLTTRTLCTYDDLLQALTDRGHFRALSQSQFAVGRH